jgi:hypothetical protein
MAPQLIPTPIAWVDDNQLSEGRVVIPFVVDFGNFGAAQEVDLTSFISSRQLSCIKGLYVSWAGQYPTDVVRLAVYGTNQVLIFGSDGTSLNFNGWFPIYTNMPCKLFFSKTNGQLGGVLTCMATNFEMDPMTWVPQVYAAEASGLLAGNNVWTGQNQFNGTQTNFGGQVILNHGITLSVDEIHDTSGAITIDTSAVTINGNLTVTGTINGGGGGGSRFADNITPAGAVDGVNTAFTLSSIPNPAASLQLHSGGVLMTAGVDYALVGAAITYGIAPASGNVHVAFYRF